MPSSIKKLVESKNGSNYLWSILADHDGDMNAICLHGEKEEPRSCTAYIIHSRSKSIEFSDGPPCAGKYRKESL